MINLKLWTGRLGGGDGAGGRCYVWIFLKPVRMDTEADGKMESGLLSLAEEVTLLKILL